MSLPGHYGALLRDAGKLATYSWDERVSSWELSVWGELVSHRDILNGWLGQVRTQCPDVDEALFLALLHVINASPGKPDHLGPCKSRLREAVIVAAPKLELVIDRRKAALLGIAQADIVNTLAAGLGGESTAYLHDASKYPAATLLRLPVEARGDLDELLKLSVHSSSGKLVPIQELVNIENTVREQPLYHKDLLPVIYVTGDFVGGADSPLYGLFAMRSALRNLQVPGGGTLGEYFINQPSDPQREFAIKWDGEWQITYETFRDMGAAYAVGLILIYLLVVAQFGSYLTPLVIMAPIPLTLIGVMPGHALLGAQFTATSMIGMIALGGIIVRNSILLVDFINLQVESGTPFKEAVVNSAITRAQPILLTAFSAMLGALFILDDPIFNGLAVSLIFGILVSTLLTLLVIPLLYYIA